MAEYKLPSATSIVDYLKSKGQDSSFEARKSLYEKSGLNLGNFQGSGQQNTELLKYLQTQSAPSATSVLQGNFAAPNLSTPAAVKPPAPTPVTSSPFSFMPKSAPSQGQPSAAGILAQAGGKAPTFSPVTPSSSLFDETPASTLFQYKAPSGATVAPDPQTGSFTGGDDDENSSAQYDAQTAGAFGLSAKDVLPEFNPSEADLVNDYLNSEEGSILMERLRLGQIDAEVAAEEARASLDAKYAEDFAAAENTLAESGLAFSGIRTTQLKALADNLAASQLSVDRELASKLLDADLDLREGIIKGVGELIKDAKEGRKEALQQLNAVGLAIVGDELVPTLAARSAERADKQLAISEARLDIAERNAALAEARFNQLYGAGRGSGFQFMRDLIAANPLATPAELLAAGQEYTNLSASELESAINLVGMPAQLSSTVAASYVASSFKSKLLSGKGSELASAKTAAKNSIDASGGSIIVDQGGTKRTYQLTRAQLDSLKQMVDTVTFDEVKELKSKLEK